MLMEVGVLMVHLIPVRVLTLMVNPIRARALTVNPTRARALTVNLPRVLTLMVSPTRARALTVNLPRVLALMVNPPLELILKPLTPPPAPTRKVLATLALIIMPQHPKVLMLEMADTVNTATPTLSLHPTSWPPRLSNWVSTTLLKIHLSCGGEEFALHFAAVFA
jgi:hypothetical protein